MHQISENSSDNIRELRLYFIRWWFTNWVWW